MITLTAKINILPSVQGALSIDTHNLSGNNISRDIGSVVGVKKKDSNPFIIGGSKLGDGSTFSDGVDYFIGDQLSDGNGRFDYTKTIKIENEKPNRLPFRYGGRALNKAIAVTNVEFPYYFWSLKKGKETIKSFTIKNIEVVKNGEVVSSLNGENSYNCYSYAKNLEVVDNNVRFLLSAEIDPAIGEPLWETMTNNTTNVFVSADIVVEYKAYEIIIQNKENKNISNLAIKFDVENNRHPKTIKVDGVEYSDDDPIFTITNLPPSASHTIYIDNWNAPLYPLVITGIYTEVDINIDYRNLISLQRTIYDRSDLKLPSFGIISNTGNIEFNDNDGEVRDYAEQLLLQSGLKCEINLNNTLVEGASEKIGLFETDQWNYDNDSRVVSVSLKDDLEEWQEINVATIEYDPRVIEHKPFSWLYEHLWKLTSNREAYVNTDGEVISGTGNYNMLSLVELDEETQAVLNNTYIQYPLLESGSLWQQWTKLCEVCQLHIYKNNDGVVVCRYNGGN